MQFSGMVLPALSSKNHVRVMKANNQPSCHMGEKPCAGYEGREWLVELETALSFSALRFTSSSKRLTATGIPSAAMSSIVRYAIVSLVL